MTVLSVSPPIAAWVTEAGLAPPLDMDGIQHQVDDVFWTDLNEAGGMIPAEVQSPDASLPPARIAAVADRLPR
jgi:hypothetical protein